MQFFIENVTVIVFFCCCALGVIVNVYQKKIYNLLKRDNPIFLDELTHGNFSKSYHGYTSELFSYSLEIKADDSEEMNRLKNAFIGYFMILIIFVFVFIASTFII